MWIVNSKNKEYKVVTVESSIPREGVIYYDEVSSKTRKIYDVTRSMFTSGSNPNGYWILD